MGCPAALDLSLAVSGDLPMDDACYCQTDNVIVGVRGGRAFQFNATTGAILATVDFQQFGLSPSSVVWDSGTNRCFAVCWNTPSFDTINAVGIRQITRIVPSTLTVDVVLDLATTFGLGFGIGVLMQAGIGTLRSLGGNIYGMGALSFAAQTNIFKFQASNPAVNEHHGVGPEYASFALAVIGGNQRMYWNGVADQDVEWWDFVTVSSGAGGVDTRNRLSIEYAASVGRFYCPEEFQFIDVYDNTGTFILQLNTGRTNFNGVDIRLNSNDGLLYICGGADNTVIVLNPATNVFTIKTGFDLPFRTVFTPTKKFAVQQGAVSLKEIV